MRWKRPLRVRLGAAVAAGAVIALAATVVLSTVTSGATPEPRKAPRRAAATDPALEAAARSHAEQRFAVAAWENAVAANAAAAWENAVAANAAAEAQRGSVWDAIAACETQGNWSMRGSTYSGGVGFANSAWAGFGGLEFAPNAGMATREQQIVVAERIRAQVGLGAWGCARRLGLR